MTPRSMLVVLLLLTHLLPETSGKAADPAVDPLVRNACRYERREDIEFRGVKRPSRCVPGQTPGTCIIAVYEQKTLENAARTCFYDYAGRLVTAQDKFSTQHWLKVVHHDPLKPSEVNKFWIGAAASSNGEFYDITDPLLLRLINREYWNAFMVHQAKLPLNNWPWKNRETPNFRNEYNRICPQDGVILDASVESGEWELRKGEEQHAFLCEAPNYPKVMCPKGFILFANARRCLKYTKETLDWIDQYEICKREGSLLASVDLESLDLLKDMSNPSYEDNVFIDIGMGAYYDRENGIFHNLDGHPYDGPLWSQPMYSRCEGDKTQDGSVAKFKENTCVYLGAVQDVSFNNNMVETIVRVTADSRCCMHAKNPSKKIDDLRERARLCQRFADPSGTDLDPDGSLIH